MLHIVYSPINMSKKNDSIETARETWNDMRDLTKLVTMTAFGQLMKTGSLVAMENLGLFSSREEKTSHVSDYQNFFNLTKIVDDDDDDDNDHGSSHITQSRDKKHKNRDARRQIPFSSSYNPRQDYISEREKQCIIEPTQPLFELESRYKSIYNK